MSNLLSGRDIRVADTTDALDMSPTLDESFNLLVNAEHLSYEQHICGNYIQESALCRVHERYSSSDEFLDALERRNLVGWPKLLLLREFLKLSFSLLHLTPVSYTHLRAHETDSYLVC